MPAFVEVGSGLDLGGIPEHGVHRVGISIEGIHFGAQGLPVNGQAAHEIIRLKAVVILVVGRFDELPELPAVPVPHQRTARRPHAPPAGVVAGAGVDVDFVGPVGRKAVRRHVDGGQRLVMIIGADVERLIFSLVVHGVELIGAVQHRCRAHFTHIRDVPGAVFQRTVGNRAGVTVAIDHFHIPGGVQPQHHANPGHPVEAEV